jgi:predicted dehydrogenase
VSTRVAVVGVGALGQHHARVYAGLEGAELAGVYDVAPERSREVADRHGCPVLEHLRDVVAAADAVSVAVPTVDHHRVVRALLEAGKDVLVEKPITTTLAEADDLVRLAEEKGRILQVGHVERFNPAADLLRAHATHPRFIEVHRLAPFTPRSLDIDVVLDLMIHDLDLVLSLDGSEAVQVEAVGVPVLSSRVDIANARLRFASGLIANLTASRVSVEKVRKFRVFAPRTYISADLVAREAQVYRLTETVNGPDISMERSGPEGVEPLVRQLGAFLASVRDRSEPVVSGRDGRKALALAETILERMAQSLL